MNELLKALEQLLIEIEPYRYARLEAIDKAVKAKEVWAEKYNRTCSNSNEMWFYSAEYRAALEKDLVPLIRAIREGNAVHDKYAKMDYGTYVEDY